MPHLLGPRVSVMLLCSYCLCNFAVGVCAALAASFAAFADPFDFFLCGCCLVLIVVCAAVMCAFLHRNPRSWTNAWFDHALRTHGIFDAPHVQFFWRESRISQLGQTQKIHQETRHLSESPPEPPRFPNLRCCSRRVVMKPELTSTQLAQKRKNSLDTILSNVVDSSFFHTSRTDPFHCWIRNPNFVRICTCPLDRKCPWQSVYKESLCCMRLCGLVAPFPTLAELSLRQVSASMLRSLIPSVTVFRDCITVSLAGEFPAACNSLRSVSHCPIDSSFVLSRQGTGLANLSEALPCAQLCSQGSLCATLSRSHKLTTGPRQGGWKHLVVDVKADLMSRTFFTSSVSNSGLITFAHVLNRIVNQSCHASAGGKPRDPGTGIFASLTRETSGSRRILRFSCVIPASFRQRWNCRVLLESMLRTWFRVG